VVLFVHGSTQPSEVAFDLPYKDYSWMGSLSQAGFDVFGMDTTGYGASTRPAPMEDPCNVSPQQQALLIPTPLQSTCPSSYSHQLTAITQDWADIDEVVDYLRNLRHVDRINIIGWSRGGPRVGGFAARNPEKVDKLVLDAPSYNEATTAPEIPAPGSAFTINAREDAFRAWNGTIGCADQVDAGIQDVIWTSALDADPTGAGWGHGVYRYPAFPSWGWNADLAAKVQAPTLLMVGDFDDTHLDATRAAYTDLGSSRKVVVEMACTSHYGPWETRGHTMLQQASLEWLRQGTFNGMSEGSFRLGD